MDKKIKNTRNIKNQEIEMKSSENALRSRGFIDESDLREYEDKDLQIILEMLSNSDPQKRTIAAKLLQNHCSPETTRELCVALKKEKKLYSKLAISETLTHFELISLPELLPLLGKIGKNQYKTIPEKKFNKKSYPLARDIIARIISKMSPKILPECIKFLKIGERSQILELIDAIGFLCFYSNNIDNQSGIKPLLTCLNSSKQDDLMRWKVVRALESFETPKIIEILQSISLNDKNDLIQSEAKRSLRQISMKQTQ